MTYPYSEIIFITKQMKKKYFLRDFLLFSLPALAVVLLFVFLYYRTYTNSIDYVIEQNEKQNIELQALSVHNHFLPLLKDIRYVSQIERLLNVRPGELTLDTLAGTRGIYTSFLKRKEIYRQLCFIEAGGKEFLRINYNGGQPEVISEEKLRDKSGSRFFQNTIALEEGSIYVSPLDVSREDGGIEEPYNPVIRLAAPVYSKGKLLGIILLAYDAGTIFEEIEKGSEYSYGRYFLVNPESFWSYDPAEGEEWDFSVTMSEEQLSARFPYLNFDKVRNEESGSYYGESGFVTFATVHPLIHGGHNFEQVEGAYGGDKYEWKLVSCVPYKVFRAEYTPGRRRVIITANLAALAVIGLLFLFSINRQRRFAAEQELREEAAIFSGNPAPVIKADTNKTIIHANPATDVLFGEKVQGKNIEQFLPGFELAYWKFGSGEGFVQFEESIGEKTYLFTLNSNSCDTNGSIILYGTDISSRKRAELELTKLSKALDQSANTIVITDTQGKITFANRAFEKTTGYTVEEAIGRNPSLLKSGNQPESVYDNLWETLKSGGAWHGEFLNRRKDGTTYWEDAVITPIRNNKDEVISYLAVKEDITKRKMAEEQLKNAKEEAEKANRLKSEFLANMSHEIRTPMNAIIGFTDLLLDDDSDPERQEKLEIIKKSGRNLLNLINDILDFSKIESGKIKIEKSVFSLDRMLDHLKTMYDVLADENGLSFSLNKGGNVPSMVFGDELRLNQILLNVVGNAFKFTDKGFVTITCSYREPFLQIEVKDSGVGIDEKKLQTIFSAFEQADSSTERRYGGTGLGLAISRRLARLMNGNIAVESTAGRGSAFSITVELPPAGGASPVPLEMFSDMNKEGVQREIGEQMIKNWLRQMGGDREMEKILYDGICELPKKAGKLEDAVAKERRNDIRFIAHDLKGFSGNLSMTEIYEKALALNDEIEKEDYSLAFIKKKTEELRLLIDSIPPDYFMRKEKVRIDLAKFKSDYSILLAEDNEINQRLIKTYLKGINLKCDIAPNGKIALEKLESGNYDLLLLDMQMPVLNGEEAILQIRSHASLNKLYVIALTAHAMKGDAEKYINLGCDDYLSKPVDRKLLYEKIQKHIIRVYKDETEKNPEEESPEGPLAAAVSAASEEVGRLVSDLEDNVTIFNPDKIAKLADEFAVISDNEEFGLLAENLKEAAESFDERSVSQIIKSLKKILGGRGSE